MEIMGQLTSWQLEDIFKKKITNVSTGREKKSISWDHEYYCNNNNNNNNDNDLLDYYWPHPA